MLRWPWNCAGTATASELARGPRRRSTLSYRSAGVNLEAARDGRAGAFTLPAAREHGMDGVNQRT